MIFYEKYEIEKEEDYLLGSLANINESIKFKNKNLFLENFFNFYHYNIKDYNDVSFLKVKNSLKKNTKKLSKNYENNSNQSSIKTRSFSFHSIHNVDVDFNNLAEKVDILSINESECSTNNSNFHGKSSFDLFLNDPILSKNII
jgi:hypothetical protein